MSGLATGHGEVEAGVSDGCSCNPEDGCLFDVVGIGFAFGVGTYALVGVSFASDAGNFSCKRETRFGGKTPSRHQISNTRPTRPLSWEEISLRSSVIVLRSLLQYLTVEQCGDV